MINLQVIEQTERRYDERTPIRNEIIRRINSRPLHEVDSPERVAKRLNRLKEHFAVTSDEVTAVNSNSSMDSNTDIDDILRERVLGKDDMLGVNYLSLGNTASRSICRVRIRNENGRIVGFGTGFMISPRLIITNNHVLHNAEEASHSQAEFNFQDDDNNRPLQPVLFDLDPTAFFVTNEHLDYSVVAIRDDGQGGTSLSSFGWLPLIEEEGKIVLGEPASIIQHPNGGAKRLALRENKIVDRLDDFLQYVTDTAPGSSGSAVFNDQWEVIALHRSGVPKRDAQNRILAVDGSVWREEMGETNIAWIANEGVRASRIVKDLKAQNLSEALSKLRDEMLNNKKSPQNLPRPESRPQISRDVPKTLKQGDGIGIPASINGEGAGATWTIPLTVTVQLGSPSYAHNGSQVSSAQTITSATVNRNDEPELNVALARLRETLSKKYYDPDQDQQDRKAYYQNLDTSQSPSKLFAAIHKLLEGTHEPQLSYRPSTYVYPVVDLQPNGKLRSIYSGIEFDPEEFIREDFRIDKERTSRINELMIRERGTSDAVFQEELDLFEAQNPYNCEHSVCQSWFGKKEPMKGDLHHLFACESRCNSFRNDIPYFDFPDFGEAIREDCGKQEDKERFEPSAGKGKVARATLYFLMRYPKMINKIEVHYDENSVEMLLNWHNDFPVTPHELHRNMTIFALQGNRNPLIDFPKLAKKIDFTLGL